jgi:tripartite-type tricarboxylate transporter receptor subunit TctC
MSFGVMAQTTIIVPTSAGGVYDVFSRNFAKYLNSQLVESFVVENHAGAGQLIGTKHFAKSSPNTLMITSNSYYSFVAKNEIDSSEIIPVALLATSPIVLIVKKCSLKIWLLKNI